MILVFDTETTGKGDFKKAPTADCQPRMVQFGGILFDMDWKVRAEINLIIKPDGFMIPKEAAEVHGFTTEIATEFGVNEKAVLLLIQRLLKNVKVLVAHNVKYDIIVLERAFHIHGMPSLSTLPNVQFFCTMQATTDLCALLGPYGKKWPKLEEAYKILLNKTLEGAHDAMADVRACADLYKWLMSKAKPE